MDWDISKTSLTCAACNTEFAGGQEIVSVLSDEPDGFARRDYCVDCNRPADDGTVFSFWHTRIPASDAPVKRFVDDDVIMDLFRRLDGHGDPQKRNFRYVLSLLLMRKKVLKFIEFKRSDTGGELILKDRISDALHTVIDPDLAEEEIEHVTEEVGQVLNFRLPAPESAVRDDGGSSHE